MVEKPDTDHLTHFLRYIVIRDAKELMRDARRMTEDEINDALINMAEDLMSYVTDGVGR